MPLVIGHEFAGEIVELGRNVTDLRIGQRCFGRRSPHRPHIASVPRRQVPPRPRKSRGIGVNEQGAFADYLRLPAFNVVPLPETIPDEIGAILDPLGNAVHTCTVFRSRRRGRPHHRAPGRSASWPPLSRGMSVRAMSS